MTWSRRVSRALMMRGRGGAWIGADPPCPFLQHSHPLLLVPRTRLPPHVPEVLTVESDKLDDL